MKSCEESMSETEGPKRKVMPVVRWKYRVKEYMHEKIGNGVGGIEQARWKYVNRKRWRLFYRGHPL